MKNLQRPFHTIHKNGMATSVLYYFVADCTGGSEIASFWEENPWVHLVIIREWPKTPPILRSAFYSTPPPPPTLQLGTKHMYTYIVFFFAKSSPAIKKSSVMCHNHEPIIARPSFRCWLPFSYLQRKLFSRHAERLLLFSPFDPPLILTH